MDTNMEDVGRVPAELTSSNFEPTTIPTLDGWIESLMNCKQLAESDVQRLCEKVGPAIISPAVYHRDRARAGLASRTLNPPAAVAAAAATVGKGRSAEGCRSRAHRCSGSDADMMIDYRHAKSSKTSPTFSRWYVSCFANIRLLPNWPGALTDDRNAPLPFVEISTVSSMT